MKKLLVFVVAVGISIISNLTVFAGDWKNDSNGWWYQEESGYVVNQWKEIGGKWYHFNQDGYKNIGWQSIDGKWYYFEKDGNMLTGWLHEGETWYFFNDYGIMETGARLISGIEYYFDTNGAMKIDKLENRIIEESTGSYANSLASPSLWVDIDQISNGYVSGKIGYTANNLEGDFGGEFKNVPISNGKFTLSIRGYVSEFTDDLDLINETDTCDKVEICLGPVIDNYKTITVKFLGGANGLEPYFKKDEKSSLFVNTDGSSIPDWIWSERY